MNAESGGRPDLPPSTGDGEDLELLAAFLDGRLSTAEHARVVARLADDLDTRELVIDALRIGKEGDSRYGSGQWLKWGWLVAAAVLVVAGGVYSLGTWRGSSLRDLRPDVLAAYLSEATASVPPAWYDVGWSVTRGPAPTPSAEHLAFRVGVRTVDLMVAWRTGDSVTATRFANEVLRYLDQVPFAEPAVLQYRALRDSISTGAPPNPRLAELAEDFVRAAFPQDPVVYGHWAAAARIAARARHEDFFRQAEARRVLRELSGWPPGSGSAEEIRALLEANGDIDFALLVQHVDGLVQAGGG